MQTGIWPRTTRRLLRCQLSSPRKRRVTRGTPHLLGQAEADVMNEVGARFLEPYSAHFDFRVAAHPMENRACSCGAVVVQWATLVNDGVLAEAIVGRSLYRRHATMVLGDRCGLRQEHKAGFLAEANPSSPTYADKCPVWEGVGVGFVRVGACCHSISAARDALDLRGRSSPVAHLDAAI
ncbi:MAG: hypothetical protein RL385_270, partial [Pseudomonadota bacterium]